MKTAGTLLLLLTGVAGFASAGITLPSAPEIDSSAGVYALALMGGAVVVILARRKR
jgi:hypothetical protein